MSDPIQTKTPFTIDNGRVPIRRLGTEADLEAFVASNLDAVLAGSGLGPLTLVRTQHACGSKALDILAEDGDGRRIAIELQLGQANNDHWSRLVLDYMPSVNASYGVLIAEGFPPSILNGTARHGIPILFVQITAMASGRLQPATLNPLRPGPETGTGNDDRPITFRPSLSDGQWLQLALNRPDLVAGARGTGTALQADAAALGYGGGWTRAAEALGKAAYRTSRPMDPDAEAALEEARLLGPQANWALGAYRKLVPYQSAATFTAFGYAKAEAGLAAEPEALPEPSAA